MDVIYTFLFHHKSVIFHNFCPNLSFANPVIFEVVAFIILHSFFHCFYSHYLQAQFLITILTLNLIVIIITAITPTTATTTIIIRAKPNFLLETVPPLYRVLD